MSQEFQPQRSLRKSQIKMQNRLGNMEPNDSRNSKSSI